MSEKPKMADVLALPWRVETIKKEDNHGGVQSFGAHVAIVDAADNVIKSHMSKTYAEAIVRAVNEYDEMRECLRQTRNENWSSPSLRDRIRKLLGEE